ncbi:MAG TPA: YihY/virulence factor BrkB family protein [Candidatus Deferrimicrobiaceae bacterium]
MNRHFARFARAAWRGSGHFLTHHGLVYSSAIAFNLLLSSIPVMFLAFAAAATVIGSNDLPYAQLSNLLREAFPYGAQVLVPNLRNLVQASTTFGLAGTALLFFTSFSATDAVHKSLSVMLDKPDDQHLGRSALFHVALVLTLTVLTGAAIVTPTLWRGVAFLFSKLPEQLDAVILLMHYLFSTLVLPVLIFLMGVTSFRYLSPKGGVSWANALSGSLFFTALATAIKFGFIFYVAKFSRLSIIYGSLFGIVSFIMVAYLFAAAYLLSASIIGSLEKDR